MDKIAIIIPCYNEEKTIKKVISDAKSSLHEAAIYVYDNNSTDNTYDIALKSGAAVRRESKQGKGRVVRSAFREIDALCYLLVDGDATYSFKKARAMCDLVLNDNVDMVVGDRLSDAYFTENKRRFHNIGNRAVRAFINSLFGADIRDVMSGFRAMSYRFVKSFPITSKGFEIETEMTIHAVDKDLYIESVPVNYRDRPSGSVSKLNTFSDGYKVILTIVRLFKNYRPLYFFTLVGMLFFIYAGIFLIPIVVTFWKTGLVPKFPTLIVCGFAVIAGIQSFFGGLILDTIVQKHKQDFEITLTELAASSKSRYPDAMDSFS